MIALFSALGVDLPSITLIVLQFCRVCLMVQRFHKLSPLSSFMFVRYSGDLIVISYFPISLLEHALC